MSVPSFLPNQDCSAQSSVDLIIDDRIDPSLSMMSCIYDSYLCEAIYCLNSDATGYFAMRFLDKKYEGYNEEMSDLVSGDDVAYPFTLTDGRCNVSWIYGELPAGETTLYFDYYGDNKYRPKTYSFVYRSAFGLSSDPSSYIHDSIIPVQVTMLSGLAGNFSFQVFDWYSGDPIGTVKTATAAEMYNEASNNVYTHNIPALPVGKYYLDVMYNGEFDHNIPNPDEINYEGKTYFFEVI